jgi:hypothetical protein
VQINFNGSKSINRVVVYTLQDNYTSPVEPTTVRRSRCTASRTSRSQGVAANWVTLATRQQQHAGQAHRHLRAFTTDAHPRHRHQCAGSYSRITEIEAWGVAAASLPATTTTLVDFGHSGGAGCQCDLHGDGERQRQHTDRQRQLHARMAARCATR